MTCQDGCPPQPIVQTVNSALVYVINWPNWGLPIGATIVGSVFTTSSPDIEITNTAIITNATQTAFELSGGIIPAPATQNFYTLTNSITLSDGEQVDVTVPVTILSQNII